MIIIVIIIDNGDPCGQDQLVSGTDQWSQPLGALETLVATSGTAVMTSFLLAQRELKLLVLTTSSVICSVVWTS